ncbi:MAG: response regulator, partial [Syntrophorhabdaceae bacterium]|nr:response regulator [Syntrophorhabdaceae bacterium]
MQGTYRWIASPGHGTTFSIHLPGIPEKVRDMHDEPAVGITGSETILVAEDDEGVRGYMDNVLKTHGYKVITAYDGQDAVEKFRQFYLVDLIILDTVMPRKNGWEAYEEIKKINPDVRVLFTSGHMRDIVLSKGLEEKEFDFIPKPLAMHDVLEKIR